MAIELTDWIAIVISLGSVGVAIIAFFDSRRARNKVHDFEKEKLLYQKRRDLSNDERIFLRELHDDKLVEYRHVLYDRYCSKQGDAQALDNDSEYRMAVSLLMDRYSDIASELRKHQNFEELVEDGDWAAIIKCKNAFPKESMPSYLKELAKIAEERLRGVTINTDPCER